MAAGRARPVSLRRQPLSFGLAAAGWLTSGCLLLRMGHLGATDLGVLVPGPAVSFGVGCDDALMSAGAYVAGIPLPALGLVYFAAIGFLLAIGGPRPARAGLLLCAAGTGVSILLATSLVFSAPAPCVPCMVVHATNAALLMTLLSGLPDQWPRQVRASARALSPTAWAAISLAVTASAALAYASLRPSAAAAQWVADYASAPVFAIPFEASDSFLGPREGRTRLVVFTSFQCRACQAFARTIHGLRARFGDNLTIVVKHFPLGKDCNPALRFEVQPRACVTAWAAEAARVQGRFWPYHDLIFASGLQDSEEMLTTAARGAGLDVKRWGRDRGSPVVHSNVERDVRLGLRLGVEGTPTVFLEGRRIEDPSLIALATLIRQQVANTPTAGARSSR